MELLERIAHGNRACELPSLSLTAALMALLAFVAALALAPAPAVAAPTLAPASVTAGVASSAESSAPAYRLYNPNSGEHFYTLSKQERNGLAGVGWHYEGIGWMAPRSGNQVFRLYNSNAGDHHYTESEHERDMLVSAGWTYEGVCWSSAPAGDEAQPLYRQYNPNAQAGSHNFTLSREENDGLVKAGWKAEGTAWRGYLVPQDYQDDMKPWEPKISGDYWLDTKLEAILADHTTLWSCYLYVADFSYAQGNEFSGNPRYLPDSLTKAYALEMINNGMGNCYRYSALFCWLARALGYDARVVSGWVPSSSRGRAPHGWVEINQDGGTYVYDPDMYHAVRYRNWYKVTYQDAPVDYGAW